jgi:4-carboxymuconolactone decarboxylase
MSGKNVEGLEVRRTVLGKDYVDRAMEGAAKDPLLVELQELVTSFGWGEFWTRPGLDLRTRSLITVAMLTVMNRPAELSLHMNGARRNGASEEEIVEVLLHVIPYAGFPAAIDGFKVLKESRLTAST